MSRFTDPPMSSVSPIATENVKHKSLKHSSYVKLWDPAAYLAYDHVTGPLYAVIVLNQPIENINLFLGVCKRAAYSIAADGGLDRILDLKLGEEDEKLCLPMIVCGDLDSVKEATLEYYSAKGVQVHKDPDQYSTDFTKCLKFIGARDENIDVVVFGGLGGRADQAFSQLHHLYSANEDPSLQCGDIFLFTPESIIFLLQKGTNRIRTPVSVEQLGESIGVIPIARPSIITTRGLEWDVTDWPTEFGTQISTSNHIRERFVEVNTTERVLFTVEVARK